ncbi:MAG TPA: heme biosynthesis HemY N-terminal domain-containing protein [Rhizomicrobium sp.]|jgi:HemY protein|nr:heme biosynthesis HemY N-terminal domain-containing protein [Rhizomicrobium sp.]
MIRLLGILIAAGLLAGGIAWIADRQGELVFTLDAYEIHMSAAATIGLGVLFTALVVVLARLITTLITSPGAIGAWFNARRMRRGNDSLSHGLLAVAAGDIHEARRHADRARGILGAHPLALLLQAQTASIEGDGNTQRHAYRAMLHHETTEFLGLRGLFMLAAREDQPDQALIFAERAHTLRPRVPWAANALFDLKAARGEWGEARKVLEDGARHKMLDADLVRRRRAVLLAAEANDADRRGDGEAALTLASDALALEPGLAPAAMLAARKLAASGKAWRAQGVVEACWTQSPHPDLAEIYAAIKPDESHEQRVKRLLGLAHLNREHFESRVLEAEEAVLAKNWAEARRMLAPLTHEAASARVCALMAEIEEGENGDASAAHAWLARAARAARDAEWRCHHCGASQTAWSAVCPACSGFDTLAWSVAGGIAQPASQIVMLGRPASGGAQPRKIAPVKIPDDRSGIVSLPRPPDDPGPGGIEY